MLDAYGLGKEDLMETMKEMQFLVDKDPSLIDAYAPLDAPVKSALTRLYNQGDHASQALVHAIVAAQGVKKKRGGGGGGDDDMDMEGGTVEDLEAAREDNEVREKGEESERERVILMIIPTLLLPLTPTLLVLLSLLPFILPLIPTLLYQLTHHHL